MRFKLMVVVGLVSTSFGCEDAPVSAVPVATPELLSITPDVYANYNEPVVSGQALFGLQVELFLDAACSGEPARTVQADEKGAFKARFEVADDSVTHFSARTLNQAGKRSACSNSLTFTEDSTPPPPPDGLGTRPVSPAADRVPVLSGRTEANAAVRVYLGGACDNIPVASVTASPQGAFDVEVPVVLNAVNRLHVNAVDAAGNQSGCSEVVEYEEISGTLPSTVTFLATSPVSPSRENRVSVSGEALAGATVLLFDNAQCHGNPLGQGEVNASGFFLVQVTVPENAVTVIYAATETEANGRSACSTSSLSYIEDSTVPLPPQIGASTPASPANNNAPVLSGASEAGAHVAVFLDAACTGEPVASVTANAEGRFNVEVEVTDNSASSFHARATDVAGNVSGCGPTPFVYVEDSQAPGPVTFTGTTPQSPANNNAPRVLGDAEPRATVAIFDNPECEGTPRGSGTVDANGRFEISVSVADDTITSLFARATDVAGNVAGCSSASINYREDSTAPLAPVLTHTSPPSPANDNAPLIVGTAEVGAVVRLYASAQCSGDPVRTAVVDAQGRFDASVMVADDTQTSWTVTATDQAGNASVCSESLVYVEDSTAPAIPGIERSTPGSPSRETQVALSGRADAASVVRLYPNDGCRDVPHAQMTANAQDQFVFSVVMPRDSTTWWSVTSTDAAGNVSACSAAFSFVQDSTPPDPPVLLETTPASGSLSLTFTLVGYIETEPHAQVRLYTRDTCTGTPLQTTTANGDGDFSFEVTVEPGSLTTFHATAVDAVGLASACSTGLAYKHCFDSDLPDDGFDDANCDGIDGDASKAIFVDGADGNDGNAGTRSSPVKTINTGIQKAKVAGKPQVLVSRGTYLERVVLASGVSLYGGYDGMPGWSRAFVGDGTVIVQSTATDGHLTAVEGTNLIAETVVNAVTVRTANATGQGTSNYGVHCVNCPGLVLRGNLIDVGTGASGAPGGKGSTGATGEKGGDGTDGDHDGSTRGQGGAGGGASGSFYGGKGGQGGAKGVNNGDQGSKGSGGVTGGAGGKGGNSSVEGPDDSDGKDGKLGSTGAQGTMGAGGVGGYVDGGTGRWSSHAGTAGGTGTRGHGGSGGGGGGGQGCDLFCWEGAGNGGGGGGAGGYGGTGGQPGSGGGGSFGVFLVNTNGATLRDNVIRTSGGGAGGAAGDGGAGGQGGGGGNGSTYKPKEIGSGGNGGRGGSGGKGGEGGGGAGGPSFGVFLSGSSVEATSNIIEPGPGGAGGAKVVNGNGNAGTAGESGPSNQPL